MSDICTSRDAHLKRLHLKITQEIWRPLCNSNVAKVSVVKWCQNLIFVARSLISSIPTLLIPACKTGILDDFGYTRNRNSVKKIQFWDHFTINTFATLLLKVKSSFEGLIFKKCLKLYCGSSLPYEMKLCILK